MSRYLYRMNTYTQTPVNCVWAIFLVGLLFGLLAFAGPTAINSIFSLAVVGLYTAFAIPIISRLLGGAPWRPGPFNLRRLVSLRCIIPRTVPHLFASVQSVPVAMCAAGWNIFAIVIVMFPTNPGPDVTTMNYTVVVGGGWVGLSIIYYFFPKYGGRYWFTGPMANIQRDASVEIIEEKARDSEDEDKKDI